MKDMFETAKERAGVLLMKKDEEEKRHNLKKSDEEIFDDFQFNLSHPFMVLVDKMAAKYAANGWPFVLQNRITVLKESSQDALILYHNEGETWRQSGNALITKWLKERYPTLIIPKMHYVTKGTQMLLDTYPDGFKWLREACMDRVDEEAV